MNHIIINKNYNRGIGFVGLLQVALIVLKLCNVIKWRWLLVLLPIEISLAIFVLLLMILIGAIVWDERKK